MKALFYLNSVIEWKTDTKSVALHTLEAETSDLKSNYWEPTRKDWSEDKCKKREVHVTFYCSKREQGKLKGEIFEKVIICSVMKKSIHD